MYSEGFDGKTVTLLGLAFKPDSDDIREAVSERMITKSLSEGGQIRGYDPVASENMARKFPPGKDYRIVYAKSAIEALEILIVAFLLLSGMNFSNTLLKWLQ